LGLPQSVRDTWSIRPGCIGWRLNSAPSARSARIVGSRARWLAAAAGRTIRTSWRGPRCPRAAPAHAGRRAERGIAGLLSCRCRGYAQRAGGVPGRTAVRTGQGGGRRTDTGDAGVGGRIGRPAVSEPDSLPGARAAPVVARGKPRTQHRGPTGRLDGTRGTSQPGSAAGRCRLGGESFGRSSFQQ
jgi:hypothetical protein